MVTDDKQPDEKLETTGTADECGPEEAVDDASVSASLDSTDSETEPEDEASKAADTTQPSDKPARSGLSTGIWVVISVAALAVGLFVGANFLGGAPGPLGKTSVSESELDSTIATYTYDGNNRGITIRDAILQNGPLESAKDAQGNYALPAADTVLTLARNNILLEEATKEDIEVSEEEVAAYATESVGSSDYAALAKQYGMEESFITDMLTNSCKLGKLQMRIVNESVGAAPAEPEKLKDSEDENKAYKKYADYIIGIVGNEWDAENGTWASKDGMYAQVLKDEKITADGATYKAANTLYETASQVYQTSANTAWSNYIQELFGKANLQLRTLAS